MSMNWNWNAYKICVGTYSDGKKVAVMKTTFEDESGEEFQTEMEFNKDELDGLIECLREASAEL